MSLVEPMDEDITLPCFRCGKPSTHGTWIITGTKEGERRDMRFESVCPECYAVLKEKEQTHGQLFDNP